MNDKELVVCFLFNKQLNKVLLLKRKKEPFAGHYNGLGGKIEENETPHMACIREVFEESDEKITLINPKLLTSISFPKSQEVPKNSGIMLHAFYDILDREIEIGDTREGTVNWMPIEFALDPYNITLSGNGDIQYYVRQVILNEQQLNNENVFL